MLVLFHKNFCKIAKKKRYVLIIKHFFVLLHLVIAVKENKKAEKGDVKVPKDEKVKKNRNSNKERK